MADRMATILREIFDHHNLQEQDLKGKCPREIRNEIALKLKDWKVFGNILLIPGEKLASIEVDKHTEGQRKIALLDSWHEQEGQDATSFKLAEKLFKHGRRDLIEHLCELTRKSSVGCLSTDSTSALDTQVNSAGMTFSYNSKFNILY